tara:strand:- start:412 stop:675 length:264 start_codon:yes stop_codon:yes gene_type:complete
MAVFTWHRMHKHEDQVEGDILDRCIEEVCDFYKIESRDTNDLTLDQIKDLDKFTSENEHSVLMWGMNELIRLWQDHHESYFQTSYNI